MSTHPSDPTTIVGADSGDGGYPDDVGRGHNRLHLRRKRFNGSSYSINNEHEWFCRPCHARLSVTPEMLEVGHLEGCPQRDDSLPGIEGVAPDYALSCPVCGGDHGEHIDPCPHEGWTCVTCERDGYGSEKALRVHHTKSHGEPLKTETCAECFDRFAPRQGQEYCSTECAAKSRQDREVRTCDWCGGKFKAKPSSPTRFCSVDCSGVATGLAKRVSETRTCKRCGEEFYRHPSVDGPFCSTECYHGDGRAERSCDRCGDTFTRQASSDQQYCTHACANKAIGESRRDGETTECKRCGDEFYRSPSSADRKYCSMDCYREDAQESGREDRDCAWRECDETFNVTKSSTQRYCSVDCGNKGQGEERSKKQARTCENCGGTFYRAPSDDASFCDRDCYLEHRRSGSGSGGGDA